MTSVRPAARRALRSAALAASAAALSAAVALAAGSPIPLLKPAPRPHREPPMRILRVVSSDKECAPNCPEWISAEGVITPGSAADLAKVVADLNGRRLPVLISSHGGSVRDALMMGALIRAKGLAVAVARTLIADCPEQARACPDPHGEAIVGGAACASACPLVLAGGVERLVGPAPLVGVHQMTTLMRETEGVENLQRTVKLYEQDWIDKTVETYLTQAGVGEPVMTLLRKTPAADIRWLSLDEMKASRLATGSLDAAAPIRVDGANGLNAHAFAEDAPPEAVTATLPDRNGKGATLTLTYRRGGGALELALAPLGAEAAGDWSADLGAGDPLLVRSAPGENARAIFPRTRLCALPRDGRVVATPAEPSSPRALLSFDLAPGVAPILAEACP
ncbi:MAG TPA: hypothetical protein VEH77_09685 [Roseiarcus sp.]|nr:hypothetical protein [Roseiarcus sp.]